MTAPLPHLVIVGRPNVGKSTLFNRIAGRRIAITDREPGITRDRIETEIERERRRFLLVDTGGIGFVDEPGIADPAARQTERALDDAARILFVVDLRTGPLPEDARIAAALRTRGRPVTLVANKADDPRFEEGLADFHRLGLGEAYPVSALHGTGIGELLDEATADLPEASPTPPAPAPLYLAIVGKRNAGKSTLVNHLAGEDRSIVSEIAGTTRDAIDVRIERPEGPVVLIDTAGLRRRKGLREAVDYHSRSRTEAALRRADVVCLLMDATEPLSKVDKGLAAQVEESFRPCLIAFNKWDLAKEEGLQERFLAYVEDRLPRLAFAPILFLSAKEGINADGILQITRDLAAQAVARAATSKINRWLGDAIARHAPSRDKGRLPALYYATQTGTAPPTVTAWVNAPQGFDPAYRRYLCGVLRDQGPWPEVPVRLDLRQRESRKGKR